MDWLISQRRSGLVSPGNYSLWGASGGNDAFEFFDLLQAA